MLKLTSVLVLSALSFAAQAADLLTASAAPPAMSIGYVTEGAACPGPGATGFATSGLLLSCQSGVWQTQYSELRFKTYTVGYTEPGDGRVNVFRYCPQGYDLSASKAYEFSGRFCGTSIVDSGSVMNPCIAGPYYHELTCVMLK